MPLRTCALLLATVAALGACATTGGPRLITTTTPPNAEAWRLLAEAERSLRQGKPSRATESAKKALAIEPKLADAHALLAELALLEDDGPRARRHWLAALADGRNLRTPLHLAALPAWAMGRDQRQQLATLLRDIGDKHPRPSARAAARRVAIDLEHALGRRDRALELTRASHGLRRFRAIAGFDNNQSGGYDTPYGPEREVAFAKSYPTSRGRTRWRTIERRGVGTVLNLRDYFYPFSSNIAYLLTYLRSPKAVRAFLEVRSSEPIKIWLNDRNVLETRQLRGVTSRPLRVPLSLAAGYNKLLVKTCQNSGRWSLELIVTDEAGTPLKLQQSLEIQRYERDRRPPQRYNVGQDVLLDVLGARSAKAKQAKLGQGHLSYWSAVALAQRGLRQVALSRLRRHLLRWPRDPLALLLAAALHRREGQNQAAALRVFAGLRTPAPHRRRFLVERAQILRRRGQLDRALRVLDRARGTLSPRKGAPSGKPAAMDVRREAWLRAYSSVLARKGWQLDRCRLAETLTKARPRWAWPRGLWASCLGTLRRPRGALRQLRAAVSLRPTTRSYRSRLARAELGLGRCSRALSLQRRTLELHPDAPWARMSYGDMERRCGHADRALAAYAAVAKQVPAWGRPHRQVGLMHYELGKRKLAIEAWRRALDRNPNDSALWDRIERLAPERDTVLERLRPGPRAVVAAIRASRRVRPKPGASVIWLLDDEASRLMPDGTLKRIVTVVRMAVDRAGRDSLGQARLPRSGLVKVLDAYVIDRRGRRREVTSMHGRRVRYPKLAERSVVVLQYRHIRHPQGYLRQHLASSWYFQHPLGQVRRARWALAIPAGRKLNISLQGKVQHGVEKRSSVTVHTFEARAVPPLRPESRSLPARDLLAAATVSTVPSWDYFSSWGRSLTSEVFEMTPQLSSKLKVIAKGAKTVAEKVRRVYGYALSEVRYQQDYETFIAGVKPHAAAVVLARGYGDCKDKSVLIIAMLRSLGIKAQLALIRTRRVGRVHGNVPSQQFNHAVVYLPKQAGVARARFLDATAENLDIGTLRGDVQGTKALVLFPAGHRLIDVPYQPSSNNRSDIDFALKLAADGAARGNLNLRLQGHQAGILRKPLANQQILRQYAQSLVHRAYPGAKLQDARAHNLRTVLEPLLLQISATYADAARKEDGTLRLRLPKLFSWSTLARWTERRHPVFFGPPVASSARLSLQLPAGSTLRSKPADFEVKGACLRVSGRWIHEKQSNTLRYQQLAERRCAEVKASDYDTFRGQVLAVERALQREVVVAPAGAKARKGKARKGKARKGKARKGKARKGKARKGKARKGKARKGAK
jgi:tetratricopeptide (TPR) repeat protein/transglutaminase-like putative cysteine protease